MMACLVNTLLQFDTVKQVRVKVNGLEGEVLPFGTDISQPFTAFPFNRENPMGADTRTAAVATVYCLNEGGLLVPTGVYLNGEHTLDAAFGCMARGPEGGRGLTSALPQGARLLSATLTAGTATLEFSDELAQVLADADGGNARLSAVTLTAMACPGVENVILNCGGETLAVSQSAAAAVNTVN